MTFRVLHGANAPACYLEDSCLPGLRPDLAARHERCITHADCYTVHRLARCKVAFAFKSPPKRKGPQMKKLQVHKLCELRVKNSLQVMLVERLPCVAAAESEEQWKQMKSILQETVAKVVGLSTRKQQDWFDEADEEIQELL